MPINIDNLSESELIDLNHRIVARLQMMRQLEAHSSMLEFRIGERVRFHPQGRAPVTGIITRYNKKTVSLITETGEQCAPPHARQELSIGLIRKTRQSERECGKP